MSIETLTKEEAKLYVVFKKNISKFKALVESGLFNEDSGKFEINLNNNQISTIMFHRMRYKREKQKGGKPIT